MRPEYPLVPAYADGEYSVTAVINSQEVITWRGLQTDLQRLMQAGFNSARLDLRNPKGVGFQAHCYGVESDEARHLLAFDYNFATEEPPIDGEPTVLYLTANGDEYVVDDRCSAIFEPDEPLRAGALKQFLDGLRTKNLAHDMTCLYPAVVDVSYRAVSSFRRSIVPKYQPALLRLVAETEPYYVQQLSGVRIEVEAQGASADHSFNLEAGRALPHIDSVASDGNVACGLVKPYGLSDLMSDFFGKHQLWLGAVAFCKALGYYPVNMDRLELIIDEQRSMTCNLGMGDC